MIAYFDRFTIEMTKKQALEGSHPGPCDEDIKALLQEPKIKRQFKKIPPAAIAEELKGYGAWDETELNDHEANKARILWIACGDIREELHEKSK